MKKDFKCSLCNKHYAQAWTRNNHEKEHREIKESFERFKRENPEKSKKLKL